MKLKIIKVDNHGDATQEYVALKVVEDTNLGHYILMDTTFASDGKTPTNVFRHARRLPPIDAEAGDYVSVWTKHGEYKRIEKADGTVWHRVYWNSDHAIWNDDGDAAVLFEISDRQVFKARG